MAKIVAKEKEGEQRNQTELVWPDKKTTVDRIILPFQTIETVNEPREKNLSSWTESQRTEWKNKLICGDNKLIMSSLLKDFAGKINLIYIDPPFATGADFTINVNIGDIELEKEATIIEEKAYRDTWGKGLQSYLQMMYDRLVLMKELLTENGTIFVHLDYHVAHYVKLIMDEIFGKDNLINEIVWTYHGPGSPGQQKFTRKHDVILWYSKTEKYTFNGDDVRVPYHETTAGKFESEGTGFKGTPANLSKGKIPEDWWYFPIVARIRTEILKFPTQKPEALLQRIIKVASNKDELVADFFGGSGTTGAVAEKLGRRWIMADLSKFAIHTTRKRLLDIPGCKPFEILNLGNYEKQKFIESGNGNREDYLKFILTLYRAQKLTGYSLLHGRKGSNIVHIGNIDSVVTLQEIKDAVKECSSMGGKYIDILGWDFEMGLHDVVDEVGEEFGIKIKLVQIPRESLEINDPTKQEAKFFDLNFLELDHKIEGKKVIVSLKQFVIANPEYIPDEVKEKIKKFTDYIDYWAVDFDFKNDTFHNQRQSFRSKKHPKLETQIGYAYEKPSKYRILIKVIDIFGNDTNKIIDVNVK